MRLRGSHDEEEKEKIGGLIVLPKVQTMQGQMNKAKKPGTTHLYHYKEKKYYDPIPQIRIVHDLPIPSCFDELHDLNQFSSY